MAKDDLEHLLQRMDAIAKAVNSFSSEAVQREAFLALMAVFEGRRYSEDIIRTQPAPDPHRAVTQDHADAAASGTSEPKSKNGTKSKNATKNSSRQWKVLKDIDLHPSGKPSFEKFIEEKKPASNEDKYPVVVYYLSEILGIPKITIDHIGTVFRITKSWKEPTNISSGLYSVAFRKATIDTKSYEDIRITSTGRNFVEHDLPPKPKAKK